jgi:O-antigen ligase
VTAAEPRTPVPARAIATAPRPLAERATDALLLVFAFVLPLSIAATEIALVSTLVAWLWSRPWRRPWPRGLKLLGLASLALLASWILASLFSIAMLTSLAEVRKLYSMTALFVVADRVRARGEGYALRLAFVALLGGVVSAALGLASFAAARAEAIPFYRLVGVFSTAMTSGNVFATLGVAAAGLAVLPAAGRRRRILAAVACAVFAAALVATLTRSSWLAFGAGLALLLGLARPKALALVGALVVVGLLVGPAELRLRATSIFDPTAYTNAGRISLWKSGWTAFQERPATGHGLQDMLELIERFRRPDYTFVAGHHHNNWVQVAVSTGLVGLLAFAFWIGTSGALLASRLRSPARGWAALGLAVWLAFQVHGFFDWSFGDAEVVDQLYLWLGIALGASLSEPSQDSRPDPQKTP